MTTRPHTPTDAEVTRGLWLGLVGVTVFALTLPMTRLATGPAEAPQLSAWFITFARIVIAGTLSVTFLTLTRSRWPRRAHWRPLFLAMLGNALGFPLLLGLALREVPSGHAAVLTALLPLATAALAAWLLHQRARLGFWLCALLGSSLAVAFSVLRAWQQGHGLTLTWADGLLLGAVASAAFGYIQGAKVTPHLGAERVICWMCVMALPAALPAALLTWPEASIRTASWWALGYTGMFSMWAGFFAWFRGLAIGGGAAGEPSAAAAAFHQHPGGHRAAGRATGSPHPGLCPGCRGHRGVGQETGDAHRLKPVPRRRQTLARKYTIIHPFTNRRKSGIPF